MDNVQIEVAKPADAAEIAKLLSSGFRQQVVELLIYGCKGAAEHIRVQLAYGAPHNESAYFVARAPGGIAGAVELRRHPNGLFLNYIGVRDEFRGQRVGTALLSGAMQMSGIHSGQIALDVLDDNIRALQWYERLGFTRRASSEFLELAPPPATDDPPAYVSGLPQAEVCQEQFGFSRFNLISRNGSFSVGRIGNSWFRLTDPAVARDPAIFKALHLLDPRRRIFAVLPPSSVPCEQVIRLVATTHRMDANIPQLISALKNDH